MTKRKGVIVTALIFILLVILAADVVAVVPGSLVWILAVFSIPGLWLFCKLLYWWLTTDDPRGIKIQNPFKHKHKKRTVNWTKVWSGVPSKDGE